MKITHNKVGQNVNVRDTQRGEKTDAASTAKANIADTTGAGLKELGELGASRVDISKRAQDIRKAKEIATNAPDVNEAKVARLQKLIDEGKYKVDAGEIAGKMIAEHESWE